MGCVEEDVWREIARGKRVLRLGVCESGKAHICRSWGRGGEYGGACVGVCRCWG